MQLKIPPGVVFILMAALMGGLKKITGTQHFVFEFQRTLGRVIFGMGVLIIILAISYFIKVGTTTNPTNPSKASKLITDGIYKYTRNPMYLGMLFILISFVIWLGNYFNLVLVFVFIAYMNKYQIAPEEKALTGLFGKRYTDYCQNVKRWI